MARPAKNNCDYFPHDASMRNHKKIKAIRSKFGIVGYGIWSMLLEHLTGNDGNVFEYSEMEFELMAGDFGVSATEIRDTVDYCIKLELLFNVNGFVKSESLDERLAPVYAKRGVAKELSSKQRRLNGKFATETTESIGVSVTEIPQSKVNEIKEKESKEEQTITSAAAEINLWPSFDDFWDTYGKKMDRPKCEKKWKKIKQAAREKIMEHLELYVRSTPDIQFRKNPLTYLNSESWENEIIISNGTHQNGKQRITAQGSVDRLNSYT